MGILAKWILGLGVVLYLTTQTTYSQIGVDLQTFYGTILLHNPDISHLITGNPRGVVFSLHRKTMGIRPWERFYNKPEYGFSIIYQDLDNPFLGENLSFYLHGNFYFLKRIFFIRIGQGLAIAGSPYDANTNYRNVAYGSRLLSSTYALLNFKKEQLIANFGIQAGIGVIHYSNANFKAPNKSSNTFVLNFGLNYAISHRSKNISLQKASKYAHATISKKMELHLLLRTGIQENDIIGSGQFPFYTFTAQAQKRLTVSSSLEFGGEFFVSKALKEYIRFRAVGGFEDGVLGTEDSNRIGIFVGHRLHFHTLSAITQLGFYAYYPFDFEGRFYNRMGLQYAVLKNLCFGISVRSHAAKAEAAEFSIGLKIL